MTALQESTPQDLQARITGLLESIASAMTGVGFLIGGIVTAIFSPPTAFAVSGIGVVVLVILAAIFRAVPQHRPRAGAGRQSTALERGRRRAGSEAWTVEST